MSKILPLLLLSFFVVNQAWASNFETCTYHVRIKDVSGSEVTVEVLKTLEPGGFAGIGDTLRCKTKLLRGKIPLKEVAGKKERIEKGKNFEVEWMSYGGMGSNGPVSGISWTFSPLK